MKSHREKLPFERVDLINARMARERKAARRLWVIPLLWTVATLIATCLLVYLSKLEVAKKTLGRLPYWAMFVPQVGQIIFQVWWARRERKRRQSGEAIICEDGMPMPHRVAEKDQGKS